MFVLERWKSMYHTQRIALFAGLVSTHSNFDMPLISDTMSETAKRYFCRPADLPNLLFLILLII